MRTPTVPVICLILHATVLFVVATEAPQLTEWPDGEPLPNTSRLEGDRDFAREILDGARALLDGRLVEVSYSDEAAVIDRSWLSKRLGLARDQSRDDVRIEYVDTAPGPRHVGEGYAVYRVRWPVFRDLHGYGLLLEPEGRARAAAVLVPDASFPPEVYAGVSLETPISTSISAEKEISPPARAAQLARSGVRVIVPALVSRERTVHRMPVREFLHRPAFELGRTLSGYETHQVLAAARALKESELPTGLAGWGEGGRIVLQAAALAGDFDAAWCAGYFGPRERIWMEPADRTVFGFLEDSGCGDSAVASLAGGQRLLLEHGAYPSYAFRGDERGTLHLSRESAGQFGKPGMLLRPSREDFNAEAHRIRGEPPVRIVTDPETILSEKGLERFLSLLGIELMETLPDGPAGPAVTPAFLAQREDLLIDEIDRHSQWALRDAARVRKEFFSELDTSSLETFRKSVEAYRMTFRESVIGDLAETRVSPSPRSRSRHRADGVRAYDVVLDVFPGLIAHGILTVPDDLDLAGGDRRPVVVCQHGLEGRPRHLVGEEKHAAYGAFATRLAQRGYVTFSPQNLYLSHDDFRMLQFRAYALGTSLFSLIIPQHEQILDWLSGQPYVDAGRIGFYGLSYGGKSAMRIPALVDRYALSICSADFNEWIWKNAATDPASLRYSYANKREYEIYEFDLGNTFNYAEMAALICPRPFMVERGHFDGVAPDEWVAFEYAKVRNLYAAQLKVPERTEIEWFDGPHAINGVRTYQFLDRWLRGEPGGG